MGFKFVISQGNKSYQLEKDAHVMGKKLGDTIEGSLLGLDGYKLLITGGSDKSGFPMRADVEGQGRRRLSVAPGIGFSGWKKVKKKKFKHEGAKKRKSIKGNTVSSDIAQINCKVVEKGGKPLEEYFASVKPQQTQ